MRAHIRAALLAAAIVLPGCADYSPQNDIFTSPGSGAQMLQLSRDNVRLGLGKVVVLSATLLKGGEPKAPSPVVWNTSDTTVAKVDSTGHVQAVGPGTAIVTATTSGTSATATVTVSPTAPGDSATAPAPQGAPELPRVSVDVSMPSGSGHAIQVAAGGDLQAAINDAAPGDQILLPAGATFTGNFTLPAKSGAGWVIIRTNGAVPNPGTRVGPSDASQMVKIVAADPTHPAIQTALGAHNYRLIGLEITAPSTATQAYSLVTLGDGSQAQNSVAQMAHDLVLDRVYIHGTPTLSFQRCIGLNSGTTAIVDSYISECHGKGFDSQAIGGWNGSGPYRIENNYLEGAGENVMFGGATPAIAGLHPADIVFRRNYVFKPLAWKGVWTVKNLFELKHAVRVLAEGNVFENNWADAQAGYAFQWKSSADLSGAEWTITSDVTFRHNVVRHSDAGFDIAAMPDGPCQLARRFRIDDNLIEDVGGNLFLLLGHGSGAAGQLDGVQIVHNTVVGGPATNAFVFMDGGPVTNLQIQGNIATLGSYGIIGSGAGSGTGALARYAPSGATVTGNVLIGQAESSAYPVGNQFIPSLIGAGFVDPAGANYALSTASQYTGAGADISSVTSATTGVATP